MLVFTLPGEGSQSPDWKQWNIEFSRLHLPFSESTVMCRDFFLKFASTVHSIDHNAWCTQWVLNQEANLWIWNAFALDLSSSVSASKLLNILEHFFYLSNRRNNTSPAPSKVANNKVTFVKALCSLVHSSIHLFSSTFEPYYVAVPDAKLWWAPQGLSLQAAHGWLSGSEMAAL